MSTEEGATATSDSPNVVPAQATTLLKHVAVHQASTVAAASKKAQRNSVGTAGHGGPSSFAQLTKAMLECELLAVSARLRILEELAPLNEEEKMQVLFQILDKNRDGSLSVVELADGLRKIRGDVNFEESIALAMARVASFDTDGDAKLDYDEFKRYTTTLVESFGTAGSGSTNLTFHDLAEMLIVAVTFEEGNDEVENLFTALADDDITVALQDDLHLAKVMDDERMVTLFHMFDLDADGSVDFLELVRGLYKITDALDDAATTAVVALLAFDEDGNEQFDYQEFTRFILKFMVAMGNDGSCSFDESIFEMTKAAAQDNTISDDDLKQKLLEMS